MWDWMRASAARTRCTVAARIWRKEKQVFKRISEAEKQTGKKFRSLEDVPGRKNKVWCTLTGGELKDGPRLKPEIFWDHDKTIGGLDDPW